MQVNTRPRVWEMGPNLNDLTPLGLISIAHQISQSLGGPSRFHLLQDRLARPPRYNQFRVDDDVGW